VLVLISTYGFAIIIVSYQTMSSKSVKQAEVILVRVLNQIQIIKKGLSNLGSFHTYNDLLIIGEIVPRLSSRVQAELLQELRVMND